MMKNCTARFCIFLISLLKRHGAGNMVVVTTLCIILFSVAITSITLEIFQGYVDTLGLAISISAPLLIFPLPAKLFFTTFLKLHTAEAELQERNHALVQALKKVKTLSGLLPICCACKKIRDDKGYWNELEQYLSDHSDIQLTHGFCPECVSRLYPELPASSGTMT